VLDKDALIKMVRSEFNSVRGGFEVDCDKWEAMLARTKELIDEIETVNDVAS
jgi:chorismate mutase